MILQSPLYLVFHVFKSPCGYSSRT
jgi:hypothetical protein